MFGIESQLASPYLAVNILEWETKIRQQAGKNQHKIAG